MVEWSLMVISCGVQVVVVVGWYWVVGSSVVCGHTVCIVVSVMGVPVIVIVGIMVSWHVVVVWK